MLHWCKPHLRYYLNNRFVNVKAFSSFSDEKIMKYGETGVFFDFKGVKTWNVRLSILTISWSLFTSLFHNFSLNWILRNRVNRVLLSCCLSTVHRPSHSLHVPNYPALHLVYVCITCFSWCQYESVYLHSKAPVCWLRLHSLYNLSKALKSPSSQLFASSTFSPSLTALLGLSLTRLTVPLGRTLT